MVAATGPCTLGWGRPAHDRFGALARAIVFQQLAGRAASAIHGRFVGLFDGVPTAEALLALPDETLRAVGLSGAKTAALRDLAAKVVDGTVALDRIGRFADDDIVEQLVAVRGIGRWTAEMFLMFQLGRLDVWPVDDLGVRQGWALIHRQEMPKPKALLAAGDPVRPFRSVAAWYCWRAVDLSRAG